MTVSREDDLAAMIEQLRAQIPKAPPEMRSLLEQQIQSLQQASAMLEKARPAMEAGKALRPPVPEAMRAFFTPEPPVQLPVWIPDHVRHGDITEDMLRCPQGARVYDDDNGFGCAIPQGVGMTPIRHGLTIGFYHSGLLQSQRFYDRGLLRWAIEWHPSGGRSSIGWYADVEPKTYLEHGVHTSFAPNGTITGQASYWNGVRHGWSKLWEDDGYPIVATAYERGQVVEEVYVTGERRRR